MVAELRAGVAGAGSFGGHHARKYASLPGVRLSAVFDPHHPMGAQALAEPHGGRGVVSMPEFLDAVDVVSVAVPAAAHAEIASAALKAGKAVYVEKPLATTLDDGQRLVDLAAKSGLVLACGHQERAVFAAMGLFRADERPLLIEAVRRGLPSGRNQDVSCVLDLMIHDLDLARVLAGGEPVAVEGDGRFDEVQAEVTFDSGPTVLCSASRQAEVRERRMRLVYPSGEVTVDFLAPSFRNASKLSLDPGFAESHDGRDPLGASLSRFLAAVRGDASGPLATGGDGLRALDLALAVEQATGL